jgi:5-oxoprolinase (ATP-hydrolysing) subunit A
VRIIVTMRSIDLNCDIGDSDPAITADTLALMQTVTSVNIACGVHAGDPVSVDEAVRLALQSGAAIGAHPGLLDREGHGRRAVTLDPREVSALVTYQVGALAAMVRSHGGRMRHVKPHGALYNIAAKRRDLADAIAAAVHAVDPTLTLVGLSGSALIDAARAKGLRAASEAFADRTYESDGTLTPRTEPGALITETAAAVAQVLQIVKDNTVRACSGQTIAIEADTICVHGDGPHALVFARSLREMLGADGITLRPFA